MKIRTIKEYWSDSSRTALEKISQLIAAGHYLASKLKVSIATVCICTEAFSKSFTCNINSIRKKSCLQFIIVQGEIDNVSDLQVLKDNLVSCMLPTTKIKFSRSNYRGVCIQLS